MASKKDKELLDYLSKEYEKAKKNAEPYQKRWRHLEKVYLGESYDTEAEQEARDLKRSRLFVKHCYQQIETLAPRFVDPDVAFDFKPRNSVNDDRVRAVRNVVNYFLDRDRFGEKQIQFVKPALIYGIAIAKVGWSVDKRKRRVKKVDANWMERLAGQDTELIDITFVNQPSVDPLDIFDFFWQPGATSIDKMDKAHHRSWLDFEQLEQREANGIYENVAQLNAKGKAAPGDALEQRYAWERVEEREEQRGDKYEVVETWTRDGVITFIPGQVILRKKVGEDSPYWHGQLPFVALRLQHDMGSFVSRGVPWSIEHIQEQIWVMENQRIDAVSLTLNPVFKVHRNLDGGSDFTFHNGARIPVDQMNQVEQLVMQPLQAAGIDEVQQYISYMETVSGATKQLSGAATGGGPSGDSTATAFAIKNKEANERMKLMLLHVNQFYARIAEQFLQLAQQYLDNPIEVKVATLLGEQWQTVSPEEIAGLYDVRVQAGTESGNAEVERSQLMDLMSAVMPLMQQGVTFPDGTVVDGKPILSRYLRSYKIEPDQIFRTPPPPPPDPGATNPADKMIESINYKDAPPDVQRQMEAQAGLTPSQLPPPPEAPPTGQVGDPSNGGPPPANPGAAAGGPPPGGSVPPNGVMDQLVPPEAMQLAAQGPPTLPLVGPQGS